MSETKLIPVLDLSVLQEKANQYAMKGAEEALKEFYTGYNSPYRKSIEENLLNRGITKDLDIPDIIGILNEKFSNEVDLIANTAISQTFIPQLKKFLTREDPEVNFSDILKKFIEYSDYREDSDTDDYVVERVDEKNHLISSSFFSYRISNREKGYELRFYKRDDKETIIYTLPGVLDERGKYYDREGKSKMKLSIEGGVTLEMPFTRGILEDDFVSYIARLVIGKSNIVFDVTDFNEDFFP